MRAIRAEASRHGHDVSPVPRREPRRARGSARTAARRLTLTCAQCGARTCAGKAILWLVWQPPLRRSPTGAPTPESYTPKHLAEKILTSRAALEGERKQVTVLFADLKGSMELLGRPRPRGGAEAPRPRPRAHDGGRPPLRGHRQPGHGRRDHGAVRRAAGPRGPRRARVLRRPRHAGRDAPVRRGGAARPRRCARDPGRAELGRGRGPGHRERPPHGLHRGGPDHAPGRPDGAARDGRAQPPHRRDAAVRRGVRRGHAAGPGAGEGPGRRPSRSTSWSGPEPAAPGSPRPPRAGSPASSGGTPSWSSSARRSGGPPTGHGQVVAIVGEPGVGQVAAGLGGDALPPRPRLARPPGRLGLVRQGDVLSAGDRSAQELLRDRGPRRARGRSARR